MRSGQSIGNIAKKDLKPLAVDIKILVMEYIREFTWENITQWELIKLHNKLYNKLHNKSYNKTYNTIDSTIDYILKHIIDYTIYCATDYTIKYIQ